MRLIDVDGTMIGVVNTRDALNSALAKNLDLVEISPNAEPPVCKIMSWSKYKYDMQKKANEAKRNQKITKTKEIKVRPNIDDNDYFIKLKSAKNFLEEGNKVRIILTFKGREITHSEVGYAVMSKFRSSLEPNGKIELEPKMEGKNIVMIIHPQLKESA